MNKKIIISIACTIVIALLLICSVYFVITSNKAKSSSAEAQNSISKKVTITFKNWDGSILEEKEVEYGETPTYTQSTPRKKSDKTYKYIFKNWDKEITTAQENTEYIAQYNKKYIDYVITFDFDNESLNDVKTYHYGDTVVVPENPTKAADNACTYTFKGWDKEVTKVTGDATYKAQYDVEYIDYIVIFKDEDGTELSKNVYHYGDTVVVPKTPIKEGTVEYTYTFKDWSKEVTEVTGDVTYTARYDKKYTDYIITFDFNNGKEKDIKTYHYGDTIVIPDVPTQYMDQTYIYTFKGWDKEIITTVNGNKTYTAQYDTKYIDYTIIFNDEDGTELSKNTYHYGDAVIVPQVPTKGADNTYTYTFKGWDKEVTKVTGDATYTAQYDAEYINYTIIFNDEDGTQLSKNTYHYGDTVMVPEVPAKDADNTYTYTFKGWDKEVTKVTGDATYTAQYEAEYIDYTITFDFGNGKENDIKTYHYGDTVVVPKAPTKEPDNTYTYTFKGWDKEIVTTVSGNMTYTAQYDAEYIDYTIIFNDEDGTQLSKEIYHYGDAVVIPKNPTKEGTVEFKYKFTGWDKEVTTVTQNATYTAQYAQEYINYTITFDFDNGKENDVKTYHYGDTVVVPENPTKDPDNTFTYTFKGWDKEIITTVSGNMAYTAQYNAEYIDYTITFNDEDGTELSKNTYHYEDTVIVPEVPTKGADNTYTYTFKGWDKEVTTVTQNATYTAQYDANYIDYTIVFNDEDGTQLSKNTYHYGDTVIVPEVPTKDANETYRYTFAGWDKEITTVTQNSTYTAQYAEEYIDYTITFDFGNGKENDVKTYHYGDIVAIPEEPAKYPDNTFTYTFAGWDKEVTTVTGDTIYKAQYYIEYIDYTIIFTDEDGTELSKEIYHYGDTVLVPEAPTKEGTPEYACIFKGWDKTVTSVDGNKTYVAVYTRSKNKYKITFKNWDDSILEEKEVEYGAIPTYTQKEPKRTRDNTYKYTFKGWDKEVTTVTQTATYIAQYDAEYIEYLITFDFDNGKGNNVKTYHYGDTVVVPRNPTKAADETYTYKFKGWDKEITTVTGNTIYIAQYDAEYIEYTIIFEDEDGTELCKGIYHYGDTVIVPTNLSKEPTAEFTYTFKGWDKEITTVDGDKNYIAIYNKTKNKYTVTYIDSNDQNILGTEVVEYGTKISELTVPTKNGKVATALYTNSIKLDNNSEIHENIIITVEYATKVNVNETLSTNLSEIKAEYYSAELREDTIIANFTDANLSFEESEFSDEILLLLKTITANENYQSVKLSYNNNPDHQLEIKGSINLLKLVRFIGLVTAGKWSGSLGSEATVDKLVTATANKPITATITLTEGCADISGKNVLVYNLIFTCN